MFILNKIIKISILLLILIFIQSDSLYARYYIQHYELSMANGCTKHTTVITHINGTITQYWASMVTCPNARMTNPNQSFSELIIESGKIKMSKGNFDDEEMKLFELMQNFDKENIVGKKLTKFEMDALIKKREKIVSSFYGDKIISYSAKPPRDCDGCNINKEIESLKNELKKKIH